MSDPGKNAMLAQLLQQQGRPPAQVMGVPVREPYPSEADYFRANTNVGGMAAEDNQIIINPFSSLSDSERESVKLNEASRVRMRDGSIVPPAFDLTPEQAGRFSGYGPIDAQRQTIVGRVMSGDPSAGNITEQQQAYADMLMGRMTMPEPPTPTPRPNRYEQELKALPWYKEFPGGQKPSLEQSGDYDYEAAMAAGIRPQRDPYDGGRYHWASSTPDGTMLKSADHPTAWKEYHMRATGRNPDADGTTKEESERLFGTSTRPRSK
tara:strand:- start:50 stop:844 length:795 start_codon:yes stop_codon:yes gene_type:complete